MSNVPVDCTNTQASHTNRGGLMNSSYLWNCSMMLYFSIRWLDGRAVAMMSSVTLRKEEVHHD